MIRVARISDVDGIRKLMKSVSGFWDEDWRADVLERVIGSAEAIALVHLDGETIEGFACAHDAGFRAYLSEFAVVETQQRSGVGTALLQSFESALLQRGCRLVVADAYPPAEPFYRARGWAPPAALLLSHRLES